MAFARGLRRRVCVYMRAVGRVVLLRVRVVGVCGDDRARVLVMCACVRPVLVLLGRRRACKAYGAGVFCVVARAGCSVLIRRGCGGGSGEVGLVWLLCVLRAGLVVVFVLLRSVCEGGGAKVRAGVGVVGVMVVLSVGCALCGGSMRA